MNGITLVALFGWVLTSGDGFSLLRPLTTRGSPSSIPPSGIRQSSVDDNNSELSSMSTTTKDVVTTVAVTGATGKTGRLVVEELLTRNIEVVGLVRNESKAEEIFSSNNLLQIKQCNLTDPIDVATKVNGCDAAIWCATGFADSPSLESSESSSPPTSEPSFDIETIPIISKIIATIRSATGSANSSNNNNNIKKSEPPAPPTPEQSIDITGIPIISKVIMEQQQQHKNFGNGSLSLSGKTSFPKVVMLSSAGITRPSWDESKKERLKGCSDIPIVRLNPFGILDIKAESEKKLRDVEEGGRNLIDYCIVRPCGLNDDWPRGARPIFSQGDVAVGRINRNDVAKILCDVLSIPEACYKTFEVNGLAGYPAQSNIGPALSRLKYDTENLKESEVEAMYNMAQQLLPSEQQNAAALAMGQTYE